MRNFYLLLLSGLLLASCVKEELPQPSEGEEPLTAAVTRSAGEKDPYKLSLVQEVLDVIKSLAETNMTIVMVTHEMGLAREAADKVVFMENGLVVDQGTPHYLFDETDNARVKSFLSKIL